ncbi:hypothetical protein ACLBWS_10745 [Brucellaceae bacterium D45D]
MHRQEEIAVFANKLEKAWSLETSTKWRQDNPACGQCGVTSLVVQDVFGGSLLKCRVDGMWHFYNLIDGQRYDLTVSQFSGPLFYEDVETDRDEAFADTSRAQYRKLREALDFPFHG